MSPSAKEEFASLPHTSSSEPYDAVILGLHEPSLSYAQLNTAFRVLKSEPISYDSVPQSRRKPTLIAPHISLFQQSPASAELPAGLSLGIGPFVHALKLASGIEAELVGKPTRRFFELAMERLKGLHPDVGDLDAADVGVVGDDMVNDLGDGAMELGLKRVLGMYACSEMR